MKTTARLTHDKVRFDEGKDLHLVLTLEAPRIDWQKRRPPVCIIPVIDVSGSMAGDKLHFAKLSVMKLVWSSVRSWTKAVNAPVASFA